MWTPSALAARERGVLDRRPMFTALEPTGVREADGASHERRRRPAATGFRPALAHLAPLHLTGELGPLRRRPAEERAAA